jgi:hypothetical protein
MIMALKQEHALLIGLAGAAAVFGIFQVHMPPVASVRASAAGNQHIDASRKSATIESAILITLLGLLSQDPAVFVIGGVTTVALDATHRVANATDHQSGKVPTATAAAGTAAAPTTAPGS